MEGHANILNEGDAVECNRLGLEANAKGDAPTALKLFLRARELEPRNATYALSAANMHLKCGDAPAAVALFEELLRAPRALTPKQLDVAQSKLREARRVQTESRPSLLWAAVTRGTTVLAECGGQDERGGHVLELAEQILGKEPTPGWEFASGKGGLKATKFHVHETAADGDPLVWAVSCVHDGHDAALAKRFVEALVLQLQPLRGTEAWRTGGTLCAQPSFAPAMQRELERHCAGGAARDEGVAAVSAQADEVKAVMSDNIELLLARGENLQQLREQADSTSRLARVLQQQATKAKRFQMWQQAKYGAAVGGAITIGAAVLLAPIIL